MGLIKTFLVKWVLSKLTLLYGCMTTMGRTQFSSWDNILSFILYIIFPLLFLLRICHNRNGDSFKNNHFRDPEMNDPVKKDAVAMFRTITSVDENTALIFLENAGWDLDIAVAIYFDNIDGDADFVRINTPSLSGRMTPPISSASVPTSSSQVNKEEKHPPNKKPTQYSTSRIHTIHGLSRESSEESSEEEGQAFYAGGSESSGQQVIGPPRRNEDVVTAIFRQGSGNSASNLPERASNVGSRNAFAGMGYVLGSTDGNSRAVPRTWSDNTTVPEVVIKFWKNGFSINDGPARPYNEPENQEFLNRVQRGEIPEELGVENKEVQMTIQDHRDETFKATKEKVPFPGSGQALRRNTSSGAELSPQDDLTRDIIRMEVDESNPVTSIQIRLSDGTRLVGRFNLTHTVADIRSFVEKSRPQYVGCVYALVGNFPRIELDDNSKTIEELGLKNSCIFQRLD